MFGHRRIQAHLNEQFTEFSKKTNDYIAEQLSINRALIDENKQLNNRVAVLERHVATLKGNPRF